MLRLVLNIDWSEQACNQQAASWFKRSATRFCAWAHAFLNIQYANDLCQNLPDAMYHLYADDTIIYCSASSVKSAFAQLQSAFNIVQSHLLKLKLVLNADKSKVMLFSNAKSPATPSDLVTSQGCVIDLVQSFKYLGFIIASHLSFKAHIASMVSKLRIKLGFYYRHKSCFSIAKYTQLCSA